MSERSSRLLFLLLLASGAAVVLTTGGAMAERGATRFGAASIAAFPLFSGFVARCMIMAAAREQGHVVVWPILLFASAGVYHHAGV